MRERALDTEIPNLPPLTKRIPSVRPAQKMNDVCHHSSWKQVNVLQDFMQIFGEKVKHSSWGALSTIAPQNTKPESGISCVTRRFFSGPAPKLWHHPARCYTAVLAFVYIWGHD